MTALLINAPLPLHAVTSIKRDDHKQKWEETEFPLVCETCLGDNPYGEWPYQPLPFLNIQ